MVLIGASGKMGAGKGQAYLETKVIGGITWESLEEKAFAAVIKESVAIFCDMTKESQYTEEGKNTPIGDKMILISQESEETVKEKVRNVVCAMTKTSTKHPVDGAKISKIHGNKTLDQLAEDVLSYYNQFLVQGNLQEKYRTCGGLQQHWGMYCRDSYGPNIWVDTLFQDFDPFVHNWFVTDLRFPEEARRIKELGGYLIRLEGDPKGVRARSSRDPNHISETALDDYTGWHAVIDNSKDDLNVLRKQLASFIVKYNIFPV